MYDCAPVLRVSTQYICVCVLFVSVINHFGQEVSIGGGGGGGGG